MKKILVTILLAAAAFSAVAQEGPFTGEVNAFREWLGGQITPAPGTADGMVILSFALSGGAADNVEIMESTSLGLEDAVFGAIRGLRNIEIVASDGLQENTPVIAAYRLSAGRIETIHPVMPSFEGGGLNAFRTWVMRNLRYPQYEYERGVSGVVRVSFVVGKDGPVQDMEVLSSPSKGLSKEVLRVIKSAPKWKPATIDGNAVRMKYVLPIAFKIR